MEKSNREYVISIFSENQAGVLNRVTSVFLRRKINIESLKVSETSIKGISMFTIVANTTAEVVPLLVDQIEKIVDVIRAEYHTADELITQEIALYKIDSAILRNGGLETILSKYGARVVEANREYTVVEMTGFKKDTEALKSELEERGLLMQYTRSGTIALYRDSLEDTLRQLGENASEAVG
ncbi:MAG: acetolactate synthase small subunit [Rikenellaceae bacterium]|jgi:acetolactate synthase-1/3 small subunit|nr:acetolactate synthase small subunit [Rikenellaceae bacterium]